MPMRLEGSCSCGAVRFCVDSHTPYPYQLCYCSICRKVGGGAGCAINLMADAATLEVDDESHSKRIFHATLMVDGKPQPSRSERHFCGRCGSALWACSPEWPQMVYPQASAIDSELPQPPERVHLMLGSKADWVQPEFAAQDQRFDRYPEQSIEDWHRHRGLWID